MSIDVVVATQNRDGGWPYVRGASWTEPTVYSILALLAAGETAPARRGIDWILRTQRCDGGSPPQASVDESTWVTALVALIPPEQLGAAPHQKAIRWLLGTTGKETTRVYRIREFLLGNRHSPEQEYAGWPWIPDAAAWVVPTSIAILALEKEHRRHPASATRNRIDEGRRFLLSRACHEGGWNHGSVRAYGYESKAYPETTGAAILALRGVRAPEVSRAVEASRRFLAECRSADALNWLRLGLLAQGELPPGYCRPIDVPCRTLPETSLELLVSQVQKGNDLFWV
jgi:hypothetical protein